MTQASGNPGAAQPGSPVQVDRAALAGTWVLDPARTSVRLRAKAMWGLLPVKGTFGTVAGEGTVSPAGDVSGTLTVSAASIATGIAKRDQHLRSEDFFDTDTYPDIVFAVDQIAASGAGATVSGRLTVHGQTRPLSFPVTAAAHGDGEVELDGELQVDRSEFGLTWKRQGATSMGNTITIHAVFTRR